MQTNKKALSPIVATILLVVVAVILVTITLSWGKGFTNKGLEGSNTILKETTNNYMIGSPKLNAQGVLSFKNISPGDKSITITGYKIISSSDDGNFNTILDIEDTTISPGGTHIISIPAFPPEQKVTIQLITDENEYISVGSINNIPEEQQDIPMVLSTENLIIYFTILDTNGTIDNDLNTISLELPHGTNVTSLTPTITLSEVATVNPLSGASQNFTSPVEYTVTAENLTQRVYTITITLAEPQKYDTGALSPGTMADDASVGTITWNNVNNAKINNDTYSTATLTSSQTSHYLKATNFGFNIPTGATIDGIKVEIDEYRSTVIYDSAVKIIKADGSIGSTDKDISGCWELADSNTYKTYGGDSDLWGETWTAENINDSDFGVAISAKSAASCPIQQPPLCLNEDSLISTEHGQTKIKYLNIGDSVLSYNETTKQLELKPIINIWSSPISDANNRYLYIYYNNGRVIKATENHQFYVNGEYKRADELRIGDLLLSNDLEEYPIENIEIIENTTDVVWDLEVEDNHNFFANNILVHNLGGGTAYIDHIRITVYYTN